MSQNFNNAKIYKITNDYNDEVYVGSTCDSLIKRFSKHKYGITEKRLIDRPLYKLMNEVGVNRFRIDLIENYPCVDKQALRQREGHFIRELGTLNMIIAGRTEKEWKNENADKLKTYEKEKNKTPERKEYYKELNKLPERKEYMEKYNRAYYENNAEKRKLYYENNREKINEKKRENRQRKKLEKENVAI